MFCFSTEYSFYIFLKNYIEMNNDLSYGLAARSLVWPKDLKTLTIHFPKTRAQK